MVDIDWSKAPRATHYLNAGDRNTRFRDCSGEFWCFYNENTGTWHDFKMLSAELAARADCVARPVAETWTGEGLPPVGTVCDYNDLISSKWYRVRILAHFTNKVPVAVFIPDDDSQNKEVDQAIGECFRPIRTAEQIAAEERTALELAACSDIEGELDSFNVTLECSAAIRATINAMLAAGYRK